MRPILLNEEQQRRIVRKVKPSKNDYFTYQNLDLRTAVFDEDSKSVLTLTYFLSDAIKRTGEYNDRKYILLTNKNDLVTKKEDFIIYCKEYFGEDRYREVESPCPSTISDQKLLELIRYYENSHSERDKMEEQVAGPDTTYLSGSDFTEWYLEERYFI